MEIGKEVFLSPCEFAFWTGESIGHDKRSNLHSEDSNRSVAF
jgi:hypothetical protein